MGKVIFDVLIVVVALLTYYTRLSSLSFFFYFLQINHAYILFVVVFTFVGRLMPCSDLLVVRDFVELNFRLVHLNG